MNYNSQIKRWRNLIKVWKYNDFRESWRKYLTQMIRIYTESTSHLRLLPIKQPWPFAIASEEILQVLSIPEVGTQQDTEERLRDSSRNKILWIHWKAFKFNGLGCLSLLIRVGITENNIQNKRQQRREIMRCAYLISKKKLKFKPSSGFLQLSFPILFPIGIK